MDGKRQQEAQVKCQGFSLITVIRGEMKGSLSTLGIQPLLSLNAITGADNLVRSLRLLPLGSRRSLWRD